ncbi:sugar porter family MFS transporter [Thalassotalea agarivorans]|uniref:MFS transporter, sugar porter (SP) family n=1 Tax=Thalassotalea agarivorans TaxID=349064 RepID=A0A1I0BSE9_THASX|nr:sugar porter family MFS transporter [Thalassotalea agarivorans]SET09992.1 MFS transporter, sugar porter (SP) family [Thalassotalea agarivorans]
MNSNYSSSIFIAVVVALGGFVFGFDASVISGVVSFVTQEFNLNEFQQGFVVSSPTLGAVLGSFFAGPCADAFGRKKVLITIATLYVVSAFFSAFAPNVETLIAARFIGGIAFASLVLAPMYIAEISPAKLRGKMISINQLNIVVGFSAAYFANYYLLQLSGGVDGLAQSLGITENVWRWMLGIELIPAVIYLGFLFMIPESPRWLAVNNQDERAKAVIERVFPDQNPEQVLREVKQTHDEVLPSLWSRLKELLSGKMRYILVVGLVVGISQQITGVNAVYFYAPSIFEQSGVGQDAAFSQAIWVGIINVVFTIVAMLLIDKVGRKPLMVVGLAGVFVSMSIAAYGFSKATFTLTPTSVASIESQELQQQIQPIIGTTYYSDLDFKEALITQLGEQEARNNQATLIQAAANMNSTLILIGILGFVASFAVSLGPVMWVLLAEIFPNHLRGIGIAFCGLINSAVSFTVQFVFPWELANIGTAATFMIYGCFAVLGLILVMRLLPETKGKSLEEIESVFEAKRQSRKGNQAMQETV